MTTPTSAAEATGRPRILVTGASGFIGRQALAPLLAAGFDVHAAGRSPLPETPGVTWHRGDLLAAPWRRAVIDAVRPSHLLHAAWVVTPGQYLASADNLDWLAASAALLREFAEHGGRRAVCLGTCFEYDLHPGVCDESRTRLAPATLYGAAKHSLHGVAEAFARVAGVELAWVRLFFLYGPHEHPQRLVSSVICALLTGQRARCSHGRQIRDFLHVADAGDAVAVIARGSVTGAFNVASGRPVAIRDIIERIANRLDRHDLVDWGAVTVPADDPPLIVADVSRMTSLTGWLPARSLEQGLDDTIDWWRVAIANRA